MSNTVRITPKARQRAVITMDEFVNAVEQFIAGQLPAGEQVTSSEFLAESDGYGGRDTTIYIYTTDAEGKRHVFETMLEGVNARVGGSKLQDEKYDLEFTKRLNTYQAAKTKVFGLGMWVKVLPDRSVSFHQITRREGGTVFFMVEG